MVKTHKPAMVIFLETRMDDHKRLTEVLHFDAYIQSPAEGLSGGMIIMYLEDISITSQSIHAMVQVILDPNPWLLTPIYASNDFLLG